MKISSCYIFQRSEGETGGETKDKSEDGVDNFFSKTTSSAGGQSTSDGSPVTNKIAQKSMNDDIFPET